MDIHGEYSEALSDIAQVYSADPRPGEHELCIPYWALNTKDLLDFLTGGLDQSKESTFTDAIFDLKLNSHINAKFSGIDEISITADTPIPFSLKKLWYDLINFELTTFTGTDRDQPAL